MNARQTTQQRTPERGGKRLFTLGATLALVALLPATALAGKIQYTYDAAGRLVAEDYGGGTFSTYRYDLNGNLLTNATSVAATADVRVTKTSSLTTLPAGQVFFYTIVAINNGPDPAPGVIVTDVLPFGIAPVGLTVSQGYGEIAGNTLTVNFGLIPPGGSATNSFTVRHGFAGTFTNFATVAATPTDPDLANNTASRATTATNPADSDGDTIPDWWEQLYFGNVFNAQANFDSDADGVTDLAEWLADTDPTDRDSYFTILAIGVDAGVTAIRFQSSPIRRYRAQFTPQLGAAFTAFAVFNGSGLLTTITHTNSTGGFYRVEAELP
jgi:uncharacterized repeat protein (TIGR01451 family)